MNLYHLLPEFTGPNMLPEIEMAHYRDNIRPNMQYCGFPFLKKLHNWCDYIKVFDATMKRNASLANHTSNNHTKTTFTTITESECYDSYYCNLKSLSGIIHALMVAMAIVTIIGFLANFYCFMNMHLKYNTSFRRNPFGIYLVSIIFIDCLHIIIAWLLFIVTGIVGSHYKDQLSVYQKFSSKIIPVLLPFWDLTSLIVTWLIIALLVQRSNITRFKLSQEAEGYDDSTVISAKKRKRTYLCLMMIIGAFFLYTIPKFAEYAYTQDYNTGKGIVIPLLRFIKLYRIIFLKFLSPSIECTIPIIFILAYIVVIKYHEAVLTHRRMIVSMSNKTPINESLISPNRKVLSVAGVSRKTQLVIWIAVLTLINLIMKLSAMFVSLEQNLHGSPKEEWPQLRQIIKYTAIIFSIVIVSVKPLIYIHCCPRLLREDLSKLYSKDLDSTVVI